MTTPTAIRSQHRVVARLLPPAAATIALLVTLVCEAAESEPDDSVAADLSCGRLEAELAKDPGLRVVDRSQINRVLAEPTAGAVEKPAWAYDAMARVSIDRLQADPAVVLSVVDLSNGNLAGAARPEAGQPAVARRRSRPR